MQSGVLLYIMSSWFINKDYPVEIQQAFANVDKVLDIKEGMLISSSSISQVIKYSINKRQFYIKHYFSKGKKLKKYFGRSRCRSEWKNLIFCKKLHIKTPNIVAYGEKKKWFGLKMHYGIIITEEVPNADNAKSIAFNSPDLLKQVSWRRKAISIMSNYLKSMHAKKFIHYDLQWRNILITKSIKNPEVYLFDIPSGKIWNFSLEHGIKRDFYNLYKNAYRFLSRTDQLRFYLNYKNSSSLTKQDKQHIKKILTYYYRKEMNDHINL